MWKMVVLLGFGVLLMACENDMAEVAALNEKLNTQVERAEEVEILYSDSASVKVKVVGPTMLYYLDRKDPKQEFPDGIKVDFYDPLQQLSSVLTAKYAIRLEQKQQMIVRDSVVWKSVDNEKLETEELIWDEQKKKLLSNKFVVITRPEEIIYGHGFEANQDFSNARINAVEGRIAVDPLTGDTQEGKSPPPQKPLKREE
ncbi:MAG: LPS export ABC transporter periplasmic protein LptC [Saprospiraceae bacterium]